MTNKEFFNAYRGKPVLYKGKDIGDTWLGILKISISSWDLMIIQAAFCASLLK